LYEIDRKKSILLFGFLVLAVSGLSLIAYHVSGHMGIEERFNSAVGIDSGSEEEESSGMFGFNIEGNPLYYAFILVALIISCLIIHIKK
jgi:hypothetical protein